MFDFRLQVFHTVAKRLNFTKAAEELFITQPAVTKHIRLIESHYKVKLFERHGSKITLTPAGQTLLNYTEQIFSLYRNLEFEMNNFTQERRGQLRLGASTTVAQYILPPILAAFHQKFEDIRVTLNTNNTEQIEQALQHNQIDLGIIEGHSKHSLFKYTEFIKDELVLVASSQHPLAKKETISPEELLEIPLLLREPGSGTLEVIAHALKPLGINLGQLKTEMQLGSTESMKRYLMNSDAMAFVSVYAVLKELQNKEITIVDVSGLSIPRHFFFIHPHGQGETISDLFLKFALKYDIK